MLGRSDNLARFGVGLDLVEVGDHAKNVVFLVLGHTVWDRLEKLAPTMPLIQSSG
jgi:hypothetical protein